MSFNNVCRLCLSKDSPLLVLDGSNDSMKMKEIIYLATGIEIRPKDIISRQICNNCCQFTSKMYQFRSQCIRNEKYLKEQYEEHLNRSKFKVPNTEVTPNNGLKRSTIQSSGPSYFVHPTITQLSKTYPQIKLPLSCIKSHIAPEVVMDMDEVETYFKKRKLDIKVYVKSALKSLRKPKRLIQLNQLNTNPKNFGTNALIKTHQIINSTVNKTNAKVVKNTKMRVGESDGKQYLKNGNKTSKNKKLPLIKGKQSIFRSKFSQKRKRMKILTNKTANGEPRFKSLDIMAKNTAHAVNKNVLSKPVADSSKTNEILGFPPTNTVLPLNENVFFESLSYIDKSVPLHICNICNSVQYTTRHLRKHQVDHLSCQFCKIRFRTFSKKIRHIQYQCKIKKMMVNIPYIEIERIEYDRDIRRKYSEAFANFPPFENENNVVNNGAEELLNMKALKMRAVLNNISNLTSRSNMPLTQQTVTDISNIPTDRLDIIEILLDEDEMPIMRNETVTINSASNQFSLCHDDVQNNEFPLITSNIYIRNNYLLNNIDLRDSDVNILKKLLSLSQPIQSFTQKHTQSDLPTDKDIVVFEGKVILKDLKEYLWMYRIPITIKFGKLKISYDHNARSKQSKKLCFWNDLTPIDIEQTKDQNPVVSDTASDSFLSPFSSRSS